MSISSITNLKNTISGEYTQKFTGKIEEIAGYADTLVPVASKDGKTPSFDRLEISEKIATTENQNPLSPEDYRTGKIIQISYGEITGKYNENFEFIKGKYNIDINEYLDKFKELASKPLDDENYRDMTGYKYALENKLGYSLDLTGEDPSNLSKQLSHFVESLRKGESGESKKAFNIDGADFSFDELMDAKNMMDKFKQFTGGSDYQSYAKTALAKAYLNRDDIGFSKEQSKMLQGVMDKNIDSHMEYREEYIASITKSGREETISGLKDYYHGRGYNIASNQDVINKINNIFSTVSLQDEKSLNSALDKYAEVMKPLYKITQNLSAPYSSGYNNYISGQTDRNAKELSDFWDKGIYPTSL